MRRFCSSEVVITSKDLTAVYFKTPDLLGCYKNTRNRAQRQLRDGDNVRSVLLGTTLKAEMSGQQNVHIEVTRLVNKKVN
jgi:hypothetical protein